MGTRPVVAGGTVFVMSLQDTLFALDARTGEWKWLHRREATGHRPRLHHPRRGRRAWCAATMVYGAYSDGFVAALEAATGQVRWERSVAPGGRLHRRRRSLARGGPALRAAYSGARAGPRRRHGRAGLDLPRPARLPGDGGAAGWWSPWARRQLHGLSPATGQPVWSVPLHGAAGRAAGLRRPLAAGAGPGRRASLRRAVHRPDAARPSTPGRGVTGEPGVDGDRVYVLSNGGVLYALDLCSRSRLVSG